MIKVSILYPYVAGARFDHAYYRDVHMPMVKERMGWYCRGYTIDKGLSGEARGSAPPYLCMCHMLCDSIEDFEAGFGPHEEAVVADIPNYTDVAPVVQISEVVVGSPQP